MPQKATERKGITRPHTTAQAFKLLDDILADAGRVHAVVRLPTLEITQPTPTTLIGIIQRAPRRVQSRRKRGGTA